VAVLRIDRRFRGPPDSGNGGYVCGLVAKELSGSGCEVTLHAPPPLDRDLQLEFDGDRARLFDGDSLIASAVRASPGIDVPPPPSPLEAAAASARFTGFRDHIFPSCFVCGPNRAEGDGLRIFAGGADGQVAAAWTPDESLLDDDGALPTEFVWAALDCPGYFAVEDRARPAVLGRLAVSIVEPRIEHQPLVVTGWPIASEGRKHEAGTALHDSDGRLLAFGKATWITLRPLEPVHERRM
jgi:hypothetical protein